LPREPRRSLSLSLSLSRGTRRGAGGKSSFSGERKFFKCSHRAEERAHAGDVFPFFSRVVNAIEITCRLALHVERTAGKGEGARKGQRRKSVRDLRPWTAAFQLISPQVHYQSVSRVNCSPILPLLPRAIPHRASSDGAALFPGDVARFITRFANSDISMSYRAVVR